MLCFIIDTEIESVESRPALCACTRRRYPSTHPRKKKLREIIFHYECRTVFASPSRFEHFHCATNYHLDSKNESLLSFREQPLAVETERGGGEAEPSPVAKREVNVRTKSACSECEPSHA